VTRKSTRCFPGSAAVAPLERIAALNAEKSLRDLAISLLESCKGSVLPLVPMFPRRSLQLLASMLNMPWLV
jgi:hypothetical protein